MAYNGPRLSFHIKVTVDPAKVDAFLEAVRPVYEAIIKEPELIFFELVQSTENPGLIKFIENWNASPDWIRDVQVKKDYYKPLHEALAAMATAPLEHEVFTRYPDNKWVTVKKEMYE